MSNAILAGGVMGWLIGVVMSAFVNGVIIYLVSKLSLGLKVKNFIWAMSAGIGIGILSTTFWNFASSTFGLPNHGLVYGLAHTFTTAVAILFIAKFSKDNLQVDGLKGAIIAAISVGLLTFGLSFVLGRFIPKVSEQEKVTSVDTVPMEKTASNSLRDKLLTSVYLTVPETNEAITMSSEQAKWSLGYVRIGEKVAQLPGSAIAAILEVNSGGNARDVYLATFEPGENAWQMTDAKMLGGSASNAEVSELYTDMETVYITFYTLPEDFGSQADRKSKENREMFTYLNGKLTSLSDSENTMKDTVDLEGTSWEWVKTEMNDDSVLTPKADVFVLSFKSDNSFQSTSDCNNINGNYSYNAVTGQIYFEDLNQTLKLCQGSLEDKYTSGLQAVERVSFKGDEMYLQLKLDGGNMVFSK